MRWTLFFDGCPRSALTTRAANSNQVQVCGCRTAIDGSPWRAQDLVRQPIRPRFSRISADIIFTSSGELVGDYKTKSTAASQKRVDRDEPIREPHFVPSNALNTLIASHWSATASYSAASSLRTRRQSSLVIRTEVTRNSSARSRQRFASLADIWAPSAAPAIPCAA
jgi:hypothetical protein